MNRTELDVGRMRTVLKYASRAMADNPCIDAGSALLIAGKFWNCTAEADYLTNLLPSPHARSMGPLHNNPQVRSILKQPSLA